MISTSSILPLLVLGIIVLCSGLLIVRFRRRLNHQIHESQKRMFGEKTARFSAGRQTPFMMGVVGTVATALGSAMVVAGVIGATQFFAS